MRELQILVAGEFLVAALMGLAALAVFLWAAASGLFRDVEPTKRRVLEAEGIDDDERA